MKSTLQGMMVALLLLPGICFSQAFKAPDLSRESDMAFFAKGLERQSPLMQQLYAAASASGQMKPDDARALINKKLDELGDESLKKVYSRLDTDQALRVGIILHLMMTAYNNLPDGYDGKMQLSGGIGVFLMYTLAHFVLMPELSFLIQRYKNETDLFEEQDRLSCLNLAFTAMYIIHATNLRILLGLSPNLGYALGGSSKYQDGDWQDIDFDQQNANRVNFSIGILAGIMLQNNMTLRLMYNLGLSKTADYDDAYKLYAIAAMLTIPLWTLK